MLQWEVLVACDTPTASVLHTTTRTDVSLKLLQFVTILLQHILWTLVLQLYLGLLLQYSGVFIWFFVREMLTVYCYLETSNSSHKLSNLFSLCNRVKSPSIESLHMLIFCKIVDLQKIPNSSLENRRILYPRNQEFWQLKVLFVTSSLKWAPRTKHLSENEKAHLMKIPIRSSQPSSHSLCCLQTPALHKALQKLFPIQCSF